MLCPKCNEPLVKDENGLRCSKYHCYASIDHVQAEKQAQDALSKYIDTIQAFTKEVGKGYADTIGFENASDELIHNMGTDMGKIFAGTGKILPDIKICPICGHLDNTIGIRRLNTAYCNDIENWMVSCKDCFEETVEMYDEMWQDYYSMVM